VRKVTHTKAANLRLINTHRWRKCLSTATGSRRWARERRLPHADHRQPSGLSCKMVNYNLQHNGLSNTSIHIFPAISNSSLASAVGSYDMQFSLNGNSWKPVSGISQYYTFNEMKSLTRSMFFLQQLL
jgi:hypothetical protein